jgi:hypothetical protein
MLAEHMAVTLGTRLADADALAGRIALETAIATSLSRVVRRLMGTGMALVRIHVWGAVRATLHGGPWTPPHLPTDRHLVCALVRSTFSTLRITRVWRMGHRRSARGAVHPDSTWSLLPSLETVLGSEMEALHPLVVQLFDRMDTFQMTAQVHLYHQFGLVLAWAATLLVGQGMYEQHLDDVDARFRLFRREDGSLNFVREFWCVDDIRVFDSDFVVREVDGRPTILEVFQDLGVAARMRTEPTPTGGLSMTVVGLFVRGIATGVGPAHVCFTTEPTEDGTALDVRGVLTLKPRNFLERFWLLKVLRLPPLLGEITYRAIPQVDEPSQGSTV